MNLGKISYPKDLRLVWGKEEKDFTPWLANNLDLLGEALEIDLELISVEHDVGAFSLDILAKDVSDGGYVAVENQLEITDHNHLGQLMTYASGVEAKNVIWISKEVREEHRKAVDWLNQISAEDYNFFAVEIQLIQIDDSKPAPLFVVKASPNDWSKKQKEKVHASLELTERSLYYNKFFTKLLERIAVEISGLTNSKKVAYDSWKSFSSGKAGLKYSIAFRSGNRIACELYFDSNDKDANKTKFDKMYESKELIDAAIKDLSWERLEEKKACRIAIYRTLTDDDDMITWSIEMLKKFKNVFGKYI